MSVVPLKQTAVLHKHVRPCNLLFLLLLYV